MPPSESQGIFGSTYAAEGEALPITVSSDAYFVLNDTRSRTDDSRTYGEISRKNVKGRIITVLRRRSI